MKLPLLKHLHPPCTSQPTFSLMGFLFFMFVLSGKFQVVGVGPARNIFFLLMMIFLCNKLLARYLFRFSRESAIALTFLFLLAFSSFNNINGSETGNYLLDLFFLIFIVIFFETLISRNINALYTVIGGFAVFGLVYSAVSIAVAMASEGRGDILIGGPNVATRVMFLGLICVLVLRNSQHLSWLYVSIPIYFLGIISIGSRGGIVSAVGTAVIAAAYTAIQSKSQKRLDFRISRRRRWFSLIFLLAVSAVYYFYLFDTVVAVWDDRVIRLLFDGIYFSGRDQLYEESLSIIKANPIVGVGLAGYYDRGPMFYPHNLVLQLMMDLGVVSIPILSLILLLTHRNISRSKGVARTISFSLVYLLIAQMFSGTWYDFRFFILFFLISSAVFNIKREKRWEGIF